MPDIDRGILLFGLAAGAIALALLLLVAHQQREGRMSHRLALAIVLGIAASIIIVALLWGESE
jgi:hypothetical protein